jgi:hypothetical protein
MNGPAPSSAPENNKLRLIPVIEFEPHHLGVENFIELLDCGEWAAHWNGVLKPLGLRPIRPGSWLIAASEFREAAAFETLLRIHLMDKESPSSETILPLDEIGPISGGYAFSADGSIQLEPGCCCDLSDLAVWNAAFRECQTPTRLLIGHGCFSLSTEAGVTTVAVQPEADGQQTIHLPYPASDFARAVEQAQIEQKDFAESLKSYLPHHISGERAEAIVKVLVFGW